MKLRVILGAGGVGKTTLAAGYAIALGRAGARVGLLGVDPSRRLQGALGLELPDLEVPVAGAGALRAALLRPEESLRRWASEAAQDDAARERMLANPFFLALADRLGSSTDVLAAVRIAEWTERDPSLTDLVIDTAPGLNAIELLRRPRRLDDFLSGRLVRWLRWLGRPDQGASGVLRARARSALGGLARIGGAEAIVALGELLALVEGLFVKMAERLRRAEPMLRSADLVLVSAPRVDAARSARALADALAALGQRPCLTVLNRAVPADTARDLDRLEPSALGPEARAVAAWLLAQRAFEEATARELRAIAPLTRVEERYEPCDLGELGEPIRASRP